MTLSGDDAVVAMVAIDAGDSLLTVCERGYGKRTDIEQYRKTRRGGKGVINIKTTRRNGNVVNMQAVDDDDELMIITQNGMMLRTDLTAVREIGRATQGIRMIRLDESDKVVAVAKIAPEEAAEANAQDNEDAHAADPEGPDRSDAPNASDASTGDR